VIFIKMLIKRVFQSNLKKHFFSRQSANQPIFIVDSYGKITECNNAALNLIGFSFRETIKKKIDSIFNQTTIYF